MKKTVLTMICVSLAMTISAQNAKGQFSIKPMAGMNLSYYGSPTYDVYKNKFGMIGGAEVEYGVSSILGISAGMLYSQQGAKVEGSLSLFGEDENGEKVYSETVMKGKLKTSYLNVPIMVNVYIPAVKGLSFRACLQMGFLVNDKMTMLMGNYTARGFLEGDVTEVMFAESIPQDTPSFIQYTQPNICHSFDFGIPVGISYELFNISLNVGYYMGLTKIDKTEDPDNARNRCLSVTLGYRFKL